jgi:hypothetical protein
LFAIGIVAACNGGASTPTPTPEALPADEPRPPCAGLCERIAACGPRADFPGVAACTKTCEDDPHQRSGRCRAPRIAYERCMIELPCADVIRVNGGDTIGTAGPCEAELAAVLACDPPPATPPIRFQF